MKVLRLKLFQQTACYKKPFAFKVSETYPLPPHSTVKGLLHAVMNANSLIPMQISIQGRYDTLATDYQTHYFFKKNNTNEFALTIDGLGLERKMKDVTSMPIYMHMLYNVELLIHVQAEERILETLRGKIISSATHLSLGRWEDLVRVDECEIVTVKEYTGTEDPVLTYNAFIPAKLIEDVTHHPYKLNWTYRIVKGVRVWDKISVGYVLSGEPIEPGEEVLQDPYGNLTFFPDSDGYGFLC